MTSLGVYKTFLCAFVLTFLVLVLAALVQLFKGGRLLAAISSRPGQSGRADGYILEGPELTFYRKKLRNKKK